MLRAKRDILSGIGIGKGTGLAVFLTAYQRNAGTVTLKRTLTPESNAGLALWTQANPPIWETLLAEQRNSAFRSSVLQSPNAQSTRLAPSPAIRRTFAFAPLGPGRIRPRPVALCSLNRISGRTSSRTSLLCRNRRAAIRHASRAQFPGRAKVRTVYSSRKGNAHSSRRRRGRVRRAGDAPHPPHVLQFCRQ